MTATTAAGSHIPTDKAQGSVELLPCPFCGATPKLYDGTGNRSPAFDVVCKGTHDGSPCQCRLWPVNSRDEAIRKWNTRAPTCNLKIVEMKDGE